MGRQHLPVARTAELVADVLGAPVSTGWLSSLLGSAADRLADFVAVVQQELRSAPVAHFDETGGRVGGKLWWIHVACTGEATLYHRARGRGKNSTNIGGVLPGFTGIAIHDGLNSYQGYDMSHALCNAHHLRELAGIAEATGQDRPTEMANLLVEINTAVKTAKANAKTSLSARRLASFRTRYRTIITRGWAAHPPHHRPGNRADPSSGRPGHWSAGSTSTKTTCSASPPTSPSPSTTTSPNATSG
jgi:transposase